MDTARLYLDTWFAFFGLAFHEPRHSGKVEVLYGVDSDFSQEVAISTNFQM
jgi:hypothetical protein